MAVVSIARDAAGWRAVPRLDSLVRRAVDAALKGADIALRADAEISVLLTDDASIRDLNARWRGKDKATNVLSFPAATPDRLCDARALGDIVVALETVLDEATNEDKAPADHLTHLIVHGVLHLVGYDHESDEEAEDMEALETRVLAGLSIADPYAAEAAVIS